MSHDLKLARRRLDADEAERRVLDLFNSGVTSPTEIGDKIWGGANSRITAKRYLDRLAEKGQLGKTETGRAEQTDEVRAKREFIKSGRDNFIQTYPSVKRWNEDMMTRNKGQPIESRAINISRLFKVCDTLQVSPDSLTDTSYDEEAKRQRAPLETLTHYMRLFALRFAEASDSFPDSYIKATCDYAIAAQHVVIPHGVSGILSRKKRNYGIYADLVKTSDTKRVEMIRFASSTFEPELAMAIAFGLEVPTPRSKTFRTLQVNQIDFNVKWGCEVVDFNVFEPKTEASFPKRAIDPRIVKLLRQYIVGRKGYLFGGDRQLDEHKLAAALRQCYEHVGIDITTPPAEGLINYWGDKPIHAMRHITSDLWVRRMNFNYSMVALFGWKTTDILSQVYAKNSLKYVDSAGRCDNPRCERARSTGRGRGFLLHEVRDSGKQCPP